MRRPYRYISADTHLDGLPNRHHHRVPKQYQDLLPRLVELPTGGEAMMTEDFELHVMGSGQYAGIKPENYVPNFFGTARYVEESPGWGSAEDRVRDMNQDGIDANIIFPSNSVVTLNDATRLRDPNGYNAIISAYNDWMAEDYCAVAPTRLLGLGLMPCSGVEAAIAEMKHCAELGLAGIALSTFPSGRANPTRDDDQFWAAAIDIGMPITIHHRIKKVPHGYAGDRFKHPVEPVIFGQGPGGADFAGRLGDGAIKGGNDATKFIAFGVFDRFPGLKIYWAENQIGWVPHFMEEMDNEYRAHRYWGEKVFGVKLERDMPSEYVREHCYWGFMHNSVGVEMRHRIGIKTLLWGNDFPHVRTDWPNSLESINTQFADVSEEDRYKMVCGNAIEFFHLEDSVEVDDQELTGSN